jgi:hypothetical protein
MATKSPSLPTPPVINFGSMSNHEQFHVVYDGPALDEHRMNVRDLAPALVAIADLFAAANAELNGNSADVRVEVKGSFKSGSFQIELIFTQALLVQLRDMFASSTATAVSNASAILAVVGLVGGGGLIGFLRQLRGRRPQHIEDDGQSCSVWMTETEVIEVTAPVLRLYKTRAVRVFLQKALSPLELDGVTSFGVVRGNDIDLDIDSAELAAFAFSDEQEDVVSDSTARKMLLIESVTFKDQNKWRVHDGQSAFFSSMDDGEFLKKVNAGERFGKGDVLVVDLQQIQTVTGGALRTEFRILKVHEHRAPLQSALI